MPLNPKQEAFCLEYAKSGNAKQSVIAAGYKVTTDASAAARGAQLLRNVNVKQRLSELAAEVKSASIADIQEMQEKLTQIIRQQTQEEVVVTELDCEGGSTARIMKKTAAIKDVISAVNTLGKMQGCFIDKVDVSGDVGVVIVDDIEDAESS
jgi:phage terminase small subunit